VPASRLIPDGAANVELKASDASGNPYLAIAAVIGAGLAGIEDGLTLPEPIQDEPGSWAEDERERRGIHRLPETAEDAIAAVKLSAPVREALGDDLVGAWTAVRRGDADAARDMSPEDIVAAHRYRY
jgi:glutamine synthetase